MFLFVVVVEAWNKQRRNIIYSFSFPFRLSSVLSCCYEREKEIEFPISVWQYEYTDDIFVAHNSFIIWQRSIQRLHQYFFPLHFHLIFAFIFPLFLFNNNIDVYCTHSYRKYIKLWKVDYMNACWSYACFGYSSILL